jgi:transposase
MKKAHFPGFAILLAGWYLIAPPMYESYNSKHKLLSTRAYVKAPLPAWTKFGVYPTRERCEAQKHHDFDDSVKAGPGTSARDRALWESSRHAICVQSDDPRLK